MSKLLSHVMDEVSHHRFTADEYYRLVALGFFEGRRVELIHGELIAMPPMGSPHATTLTLVLQALQRLFAVGYVVRHLVIALFYAHGVAVEMPKIAGVP